MLDKDDESDLLDMLDVIAKRPEFKFVKSFATMRQLPDESSETISESERGKIIVHVLIYFC